MGGWSWVWGCVELGGGGGGIFWEGFLKVAIGVVIVRECVDNCGGE